MRQGTSSRKRSHLLRGGCKWLCGKGLTLPTVKQCQPLILTSHTNLPGLRCVGVRTSRSYSEGAVDAPKGAAEIRVSVAPLSLTAMIEVDDSELEEDDHEFLTRWAEALQVPLGVLVLRIVEATIDGEQYIKGRPRD